MSNEQNPLPRVDEAGCVLVDSQIGNAVATVYAAWVKFETSRGPLAQAHAVVDLQNAMHDLSTWLPGYDVETGIVTIPWREPE